ncbi:MAG: hypothetical protein RLZZ223_345 [Candidatus Parcubacteria bacterium]|jgi:rod shape-determining protein MreC
MINKNKSIIFSLLILSFAVLSYVTGFYSKILRFVPLVSFSHISEANEEMSIEQLKAKVISLEAEVASLLYLKSENDLLKSAIDTKNSTGITPIQAKILTFDNNFTRSSAMVSVGSNEGVRVNQPVIYLGHLVGVVKEVSENSSQVQFLNDADSKVAVAIQNVNSSQGIIKSRFGTVLEVDSISKLESVSKDTNVVTTPTETIPGGLLVGKIQDVTEGDLFHNIIINHPINFYQLTEVFILKT